MVTVQDIPFEQLFGQVEDQVNFSSAAGLSSYVTVTLSLAPGDQTRANFKRLAEEWRRETSLVSSMTKTVMHPAYQKIIGMGPLALPLILEDLRDQGGHWFWALRAITQENPADGHITFEGARRVWLEWGKARGHIQ